LIPHSLARVRLRLSSSQVEAKVQRAWTISLKSRTVYGSAQSRNLATMMPKWYKWRELEQARPVVRYQESAETARTKNSIETSHEDRNREAFAAKAKTAPDLAFDLRKIPSALSPALPTHRDPLFSGGSPRSAGDTRLALVACRVLLLHRVLLKGGKGAAAAAAAIIKRTRHEMETHTVTVTTISTLRMKRLQVFAVVIVQY